MNEMNESSPASAIDSWDRALDRVIPNVVRIKFYNPHAFDSTAAGTDQGTGFVVDAEKGLILTNRHIIGPGPFVGRCVFSSREEVACKAIYRDPVHDFGFLKYDPKAIKFAQIDGLQLAPDQAKVGTEFRMIGNDGGEDLAILSGFISRIDRNSPEYENADYRDFNTCYYQANASSSGGSSGSPVVANDGTVIAMQAGGRDNTSTDYFLPLYRPLRALQCLQKCEPVARGDIQCQFTLKTFEKCRDLGLSEDLERRVRKTLPDETSMLVAEVVLPDGPSHNKIEPGDVLVTVNGKLLTQFVRLEEILDSSVGGTVELALLRNGETEAVDIEVGNLHDITPDRFVSVAGATFHDLSYLQARTHGVACKGVYVCETSPSFFLGENSGGWILDKINHKKVPSLATFIKIAKSIPDRALVLVKYHHLSDPNRSYSKEIYFFNKHFYTMTLAVRNDETGFWDFTTLGDPSDEIETPKRQAASFSTLGQGALPYPFLQELHHSFVRVECTMPMSLDGFLPETAHAMGIVINADEGLVCVSSAIVPHSCCDITIIIADTIVVEAHVQSVHPTVNLTVVKYNPSLVDAPVKSARLSSNKLFQGGKTLFFGYNDNDEPVFAPTTVAEISTLAIPATVDAPCYRVVNVEGIKIESSLGYECASGVLLDSDGAVEALWLTFMGEDDHDFVHCLSTATLLPVLDAIQQRTDAQLRLLPVELSSISMAQASARGISSAWIDKVVEASPERHQLFAVSRCAAQNTDTDDCLMVDDVVLTLNEKICTTFSDFDVMYKNKQLDAVIVRDGMEKSLVLRTVAANANETTRAVSFCGALLQAPHADVRQQMSKQPPSQVYISSGKSGSPMHCYRIFANRFITKINGEPTPDLDTFITVTKNIPHGTSLRVGIESLQGVPCVVTVTTDLHYFPLVEWTKKSKGKGQWRKITHTTLGGNQCTK